MLSLEAAGTVDKTKVRVIDRMTVPGYPWAVRSKLDKDFVDKVVAAFQGIKDPDLLKLLKATSYTRVQDSGLQLRVSTSREIWFISNQEISYAKVTN